MSNSRLNRLLQICVGVGFALTLATQHKLVVWPDVEPVATDTPTDSDSSQPKKAPLSFASVAEVVATPPRWARESREQFDPSRYIDFVSYPSLSGGYEAPIDAFGVGSTFCLPLSDSGECLRRAACRVVAAAMQRSRTPGPLCLPQRTPTGPPLADIRLV